MNSYPAINATEATSNKLVTAGQSRATLSNDFLKPSLVIGGAFHRINRRPPDLDRIGKFQLMQSHTYTWPNRSMRNMPEKCFWTSELNSVGVYPNWAGWVGSFTFGLLNLQSRITINTLVAN